MSGISTNSRTQIKLNLLRKAWYGASEKSQAEMWALIKKYEERGNTVPAEHQQELDEINTVRNIIQECLEQAETRAEGREDPPELKHLIEEEEKREAKRLEFLRASGMEEDDLPRTPKAILRLNALERLRDSGGNWVDQNQQDALSFVNQKPPTNSLN